MSQSNPKNTAPRASLRDQSLLSTQRLHNPLGLPALYQGLDQLNQYLSPPRDGRVVALDGHMKEYDSPLLVTLPELGQAGVVDEIAQVAPGVLGGSDVDVLIWGRGVSWLVEK